MELAIPILPADDLRAARAFYVDGLGFTVRFEVSEDGTTGLLGLARGNTIFVIGPSANQVPTAGEPT